MWKNAIQIKLSLIHHYNIHIIQNDLHLGTFFFYPCIPGKYTVYKRKDHNPRSPLSQDQIYLCIFSTIIFFYYTLTLICRIIFSKFLLQPIFFGKCLLKALRIPFFEIPVVRVNHIIYSNQLSSVQL